MTPEEEAAYDAELERKLKEAQALCPRCLGGGTKQGCPKCGRVLVKSTPKVHRSKRIEPH